MVIQNHILSTGMLSQPSQNFFPLVAAGEPGGRVHDGRSIPSEAVIQVSDKRSAQWVIHGQGVPPGGAEDNLSAAPAYQPAQPEQRDRVKNLPFQRETKQGAETGAQCGTDHAVDIQKNHHLQVVLEEPLHGAGVGFFIAAVYGNGNCIAFLDIESHNRKDLGSKGGFAPNLPDGNGAVKSLGGSDQQSGMTGMNAHWSGDGILKACHSGTPFLKHMRWLEHVVEQYNRDLAERERRAKEGRKPVEKQICSMKFISGVYEANSIRVGR